MNERRQCSSSCCGELGTRSGRQLVTVASRLFIIDYNNKDRLASQSRIYRKVGIEIRRTTGFRVCRAIVFEFIKQMQSTLTSSLPVARSPGRLPRLRLKQSTFTCLTSEHKIHIQTNNELILERILNGVEAISQMKSTRTWR